MEDLVDLDAGYFAADVESALDAFERQHDLGLLEPGNESKSAALLDNWVSDPFFHVFLPFVPRSWPCGFDCRLMTDKIRSRNCGPTLRPRRETSMNSSSKGVTLQFSFAAGWKPTTEFCSSSASPRSSI